MIGFVKLQNRKNKEGPVIYRCGVKVKIQTPLGSVEI